MQFRMLALGDRMPQFEDAAIEVGMSIVQIFHVNCRQDHIKFAVDFGLQ